MGKKTIQAILDNLQKRALEVSEKVLKGEIGTEQVKQYRGLIQEVGKRDGRRQNDEKLKLQRERFEQSKFKKAA